MPRSLRFVALALVVLGASAQATPPERPDDGLPLALASDTRSLQGQLLDVANGTVPDAWSRANGSHAAVARFFADLAPGAAARLASYMDLLGPAVRDGNETDVRSLAQAAARTVEREILPVTEAWQQHRTGVVVGTLRATDAGLEAPLVLVNVPPGGFAAFEVALHYDPSNLTARGARLSTGQGDAHVDTANGTVRFASFDAKGLAGLGSAGVPVELGRAVFERPVDGPHPLRVEVVDLVDRQGEPILALGALSALDADAAVQGDTAAGVSRLAAVGVVVVLGVGVAVAARKFLKV